PTIAPTFDAVACEVRVHLADTLGARTTSSSREVLPVPFLLLAVPGHVEPPRWIGRPREAATRQESNRMTTTFADLGVSEADIRALAARGIEAPFPIQALVIGDATEGRDVLARSKTGSGKTLAFALPIVERLRA